MNDSLKSSVEKLITSINPSDFAKSLMEIFIHTMRTEESLQKQILQEVTNCLKKEANKRIQEIIESNTDTGYFVASGQVADLIYITTELKEEDYSDPRVLLEEMFHIAYNYSNAKGNNNLIVKRIEEILEYCRKEFPCFSKTKSKDFIMIILPSVATEFIAECVNSKNIILILNPKYIGVSFVENETYDAIAQRIANGIIPQSAKELLAHTMESNYSMSSDTIQMETYLEYVKEGLCYQGPYCEMVDTRLTEKTALQWNEYLRRL